MSGVKRKHVTLSLNEKLAVLQRLDKGESLQQIAKELNVGVTTIKDWRKNRKDIESYTITIDGENALKHRKTLKRAKLELLDNALWMWFCQERRKGTPISGPILKEKAIVLHKKLKAASEFAASEGWIDRWKNRHGVRFVSISGEKLSADNEAAREFCVKFQEIFKENEMLPCQVYNIDETGLNFKMLPTKTLAASNESVTGTKLMKDRITVAPCSNADGTHKLPLFVIGKSKKPRAFKNLNPSSLPVYYRNQKSAWMDCNLFKSWFFDEFVPSVEKNLKEKKLPARAILLLDNAPSHPPEQELVKGDIKALFLPPNVTSLIQPMDQGAIEWLKRRYRRKYISSILEKSEQGFNIFEAMKSLTIKDAIYTIAASWDELKPDTLRKSWRKLWPEVMTETDQTEDQQNNDSQEIVKDLQTLDPNVLASEVEDWITECDKDCDSYEELDDDQILAAVIETDNKETANEDSYCEEDELPTRISHTDAKNAFDIALQYIEQNPTSTPMDILWIKKWRDTAAKSRISCAKQKSITDFFTK
ncbi:unnamed protein product [Callosobruchus maculatus]|uniref:Uncharacterized protein n=1 Tax=Callosobruchus maculatus TaxID=64391 RepID=A0A653C6T2_CALMS|nr:unnamed protein product [Callosobruchus maculatus]